MADKKYIFAEITRAWAVKQLAMGKRPAELYRVVTDMEKCKERLITPYDGTRAAWFALMNKIPADEIRAARAEYMADLTDVDLAEKKMRILELVDLYDGIKINKTSFDRDRVQTKRLLLQDIAKEVGEDAWREAMKARGADGSAPVTQVVLEQALAIMKQAQDEGESWK